MRQLKITKSITNRETQSVDKYLQEIGKGELLTIEEEVETVQKIKRGDQAAFERLIKANLKFVVSVSKQYQNQGLPLADIINEGNLGLIKAAQRFDETRGFKFISYAVWWIRQSILQALAEHARVVRIPLNQVSSINKVNKAFSKLEQEFEREPTDEELAEILDITLGEVQNSIAISGRHLSMDAPLAAGEEGTLLDVLQNHDIESPEKSIERESLKKDLSMALKALPKNNRYSEIIEMYFGLNGRTTGMSVSEIGEEIGLGKERVRQLKEKGIKFLRRSAGKDSRLRIYLG